MRGADSCKFQGIIGFNPSLINVFINIGYADLGYSWKWFLFAPRIVTGSFLSWAHSCSFLSKRDGLLFSIKWIYRGARVIFLFSSYFFFLFVNVLYCDCSRPISDVLSSLKYYTDRTPKSYIELQARCASFSYLYFAGNLSGMALWRMWEWI